MEQKTTLYTGELKGTPIGDLWLAVSDLGLAAVEWGKSQAEFDAYLSKRFKRTVEYAPEHVREAARQVKEYLSGKRRAFTLIIDWTVMRQFQQLALHATCDIPYGETKQFVQRVGHWEGVFKKVHPGAFSTTTTGPSATTPATGT